MFDLFDRINCGKSSSLQFFYELRDCVNITVISYIRVLLSYSSVSKFKTEIIGSMIDIKLGGPEKGRVFLAGLDNLSWINYPSKP